MKNKIILLITFIVWGFTSGAQVYVSLNNPISEQIKLADMFNVTITNSGNSTIQVELEGIIKTRKGESVVKGKSASFTVNPGLTMVRPTDLSLEYTFFRQNIQAGSDIPYGEYVMCSNLIWDGQSTNSCLEIQVKPLTPPFLVMPENNSVTDSRYPQFLWQPPAPVSMNQVVLYDFKLVKLLQGQSCSQAIAVNNAEYETSGIRSAALIYPASSIRLDTGITYCWQVSARTDEYGIGRTEAWTFKINEPQVHETPVVNQFIILRKNQDAAVYEVTDGILRIAFKEEYKAGELKCEITDLQTNKSVAADCISGKVRKTGNNQYELNLNECRLKHGTYQISMSDQKNDKYTAKFSY